MGNKNYQFDNVIVDCSNFRVAKDGEALNIKPRDFDVLVYLIENADRVVEKQELFEKVWKDTFVSDNALTKIIKEIRRELGDSADDPRYIETVPKRGYRFIGRMTSDDNPFARVPVASNERESEPKTELSSAVGSKVAKYVIASLAAGVVIAIAVASWLFFREKNDETRLAQLHSIAVLPFVNESADPSLEYLSDGMTETLISTLSRIPGVSIKARSSVFRYKGREVRPSIVGSELGVQAILNGRVVQRGQDVVLYVELTDVATENVLWKSNYNRSVRDLVSLESEIASDVSRRLRSKLSEPEGQRIAKRDTENPDAYQLYLKGRYYWNRRTVVDLRRSIDYLQKAIEADPNYALAYASLAQAYELLSEYGGAPSQEVIPKALTAASKALSLDDQLASGHVALALALNGDYDLNGSQREFKRAIELDPSDASSHQLYAVLLTQLSKYEEALAEDRRALEIDPLSLIINRSYADNLFYARRYEDAEEQLRKTLELDENFASAYATLFNVCRMKEDYAASVEAFAKHKELTGDAESASVMRETFARGGWKGFLIAMTHRREQANFTRYLVATFHAGLGENDKAISELNMAFHDREYFLVRLNTDPRFDSLREDSRFQDLLRRVGFKK